MSGLPFQQLFAESSPTSDDDVPNESSTQDKSIKFMEISNADETKIEAKTNGNDSDSTSVLETEETIKKESAVTKENNLLQEETIPATYPSRDPTSVTSRQQPKSKQEEEQLATKYAQIVNVSERAYQILVDLGMVDESEQIDVTKFNGTIDLEN